MAVRAGERKYGILGLALAVVIAGVGSFLVATWYHAAVYVPDSTADDVRPASDPPVNVAPISNTDAESSSPADSRQPPLVPVIGERDGQTDQAQFQLTVVVEDQDGNRLSDVKIGVRLLRPVSQSKRTVRQTLERVSDASGESRFEVPRGDSVRIDVLSDDWHCYPVEARPESDAVQRLILDPARAVTLTAMYDDGTAFSWQGDLADDADYSVSFSFDAQGSVVVPKVRVSGPLTCSLFAGQRPGYETHREVIGADRLITGGPINLIIPQSNKAGLRVLFDPPLATSCVLIVERAQERGGDSAVRAALGTGAESWWSGTLYPGTRCRVTILGPLSWRSDWLTIERSKVHELRAVLSSSGTARVLITDEAGSPVKGATLRISDGEYLSVYSNTEQRPAPGCAVSDDNGFAELTGLPAGEIELEAEGNGLEVRILQVRIQANQVTDLGAIELPPAVGRINVRLVGADPNLQYCAVLNQAGVTALTLPKQLKDGACVFEKLPLRAYRVTVFVATGGEVRPADVVLDGAESEQIVEVDVTGLKRKD
jgi:hypothetical protein